MGVWNGTQIGDRLKELFWKLPLSLETKERISALRYKRALARESSKESTHFEVRDDAELLREYATYVLGSYDVHSEAYVEYREMSAARNDVLLAAYYLTQFHPDAHNEAWWGRGTTEWNNVNRAVPQFLGHYQPRRPGELGYYDLRIKDNMRRQIQLAKNYGIGAFCFYYYWFDNGERLLEEPLNTFLEDKTLEMPFFYCWANENWTRRFSGVNSDVLIGITHDVDVYLSFMKNVSKDFNDERYLRINGRPVLSVYQPSFIPETESVLEKWRSICRDTCGDEPYLIAIQGRDTNVNWTTKGFDAESEFQPRQVQRKCHNITARMKPLRVDFDGTVYDYADLVNSRCYATWNRDKKVFPAVMPMWDNTARRNYRGTIYHGSTPELYGKWLTDAILEVRGRFDLDAKMVFINAWNEWGEGAYLEPDAYWGYAYLDATRKAIDQSFDIREY